MHLVALSGDGSVWVTTAMLAAGPTRNLPVVRLAVFTLASGDVRQTLTLAGHRVTVAGAAVRAKHVAHAFCMRVEWSVNNSTR